MAHKIFNNIFRMFLIIVYNFCVKFYVYINFIYKLYTYPFCNPIELVYKIWMD